MNCINYLNEVNNFYLIPQASNLGPLLAKIVKVAMPIFILLLIAVDVVSKVFPKNALKIFSYPNVLAQFVLLPGIHWPISPQNRNHQSNADSEINLREALDSSNQKNPDIAKFETTNLFGDELKEFILQYPFRPTLSHLKSMDDFLSDSFINALHDGNCKLKKFLIRVFLDNFGYDIDKHNPETQESQHLSTDLGHLAENAIYCVYVFTSMTSTEYKDFLDANSKVSNDDLTKEEIASFRRVVSKINGVLQSELQSNAINRDCNEALELKREFINYRKKCHKLMNKQKQHKLMNQQKQIGIFLYDCWEKDQNNKNNELWDSELKKLLEIPCEKNDAILSATKDRISNDLKKCEETFSSMNENLFNKKEVAFIKIFLSMIGYKYTYEQFSWSRTTRVSEEYRIIVKNALRCFYVLTGMESNDLDLLVKKLQVKNSDLTEDELIVYGRSLNTFSVWNEVDLDEILSDN